MAKQEKNKKSEGGAKSKESPKKTTGQSRKAAGFFRRSVNAVKNVGNKIRGFFRRG